MAEINKKIIDTQAFHFLKHEEIHFNIDLETPNFNYVTMDIESNINVKAFLVAKVKGQDKYIFEDFFIESRSYELKFFMTSITEDIEIEKIMYLRLYNLQSSTGLVKIKNLNIDCKQRLCKDERIYIENSKLIIGLNPYFGGVVNYLSSKVYQIAQDREGNIKFYNEKPIGYNLNLINNHDKGRNVQQSFYGINKPPYQVGNSFMDLWRYNPVQVGDRFGNLSKIIDYKIKKNSIYLKIRPLDYAKNNYLLDCYMEITYSLNGGVLVVDNRFIDFSMYCHKGDIVCLQEVPAFYTLNNFNNYSYLTNTKKHHTVKDLQYWGSEEVAYKQTYNVHQNWSAWTNDENFGIGLYTPHSSLHRAGKYNSSKDNLDLMPCRNDSVNYISALSKFDIESLTSVNYKFYITIGSLTEISKNFAKLHEDDKLC